MKKKKKKDKNEEKVKKRQKWKKEKKDKNEENEDDEIPEEGTLIKKIVYTVLPGNYVQQEVFNGTEKEPREVKVLKNKREYEPYITDVIENLNNEETKQYFLKDNYNVGSYIESKIEENNEGVLMYTKVTHYVKPY